MIPIDWSRRCDLRTMTPAELKIREAIEAVEGMGADPRLTDAVTLLSSASEAVADYTDGVPRRIERYYTDPKCIVP